MQKKTIKDVILSNPYFFAPYFLFLLIGAILIITNQKGEILLWFNTKHTVFFDNYFKYSSILGKGIIFGYFLLLLGIYRFKYLIIGVSTFLGSGLVTHILKRMFKEVRPKLFFDNIYDLNLIEGVKLYSQLSFPSGHTTAGFSMFIFFALITKYKPLGAVFFIFALSIGLSRVYLVQHFFIDIYFGSLIGTFISVFIYLLFVNSKKTYSSNWFNYSLFERLLIKKTNKN